MTASLAIAALCLTTQVSETLPNPTAEAALQPPAQATAPSEYAVQLLKNGHPQFELLDLHGKRHKASLVQIEGDNIVLRTQRGLFTVPAEGLQRSVRRGDPSWDGALEGLSVGVGLSLLVVQNSGCLCWKSDNPDVWTMQDSLSLMAFSASVGWIIDALHVGRHSVLVGSMPTTASKPKPTLTLGFSGAPHARKLHIGYQVAF